MTAWRWTRIAVAALVGAAACADAARDGAPAPDRLRAIVMPYLNLMPFYIAEDQGYFAEANLDVEFVRVSRNQDIMAALATGDVDVAGGMLTVNELNLAASGTRLRFVAAMGELSPEHCPNAAMVVRRDVMESGALESADGIRRLRFDFDEMIPIGYWSDLLLRRHGVTIDDVEWVSLSSPAAVEALANGSIDATLEGEPFVSILADDGAAVVWEGAETVAPGFVVSMLMYGARLLDEEPDVGRRLAVAMVRAIRRYGEGKTPSNLASVERGTGLTPEQVRDVCWPFMRADARIDTEVLRGYQAWSVERGLADRVLDNDELYDFRFVEHANRVLDGG